MSDSGTPLHPAPKPSRLRHDILLSLTGNVVFALSQWLVLITVAQFGTMREVGMITLITAVAAPIFAFSGLSLREVQAVDTDQRHAIRDYIGLRAFTATLATVISLGLIALFYRGQGLLFLATAAGFVATKIFQSQSNLNDGIYQRFQRMDFVATGAILRGVLGMGAFFVTYLVTRNLPLAFAAQAAAWAVVLLGVEPILLRRLGVHERWTALFAVSPRQVWRLFLWLSPMALSVLLQSGVVITPRLVMGHFAPLAEVGLFGAIAYFQTAVQLLTAAIAQASVSRLARRHKAGDRARFLSLTLRILMLNLCLGAMIVAVAWAFGDRIVALVYGKQYVDPGLLLLVAVTVAITLTGSVFHVAMTAMLNFRARMLTNLAAFVFALTTALALIPQWGATGAGVTLVAAACFSMLAGMVAYARLLRAFPQPQLAAAGQPA